MPTDNELRERQHQERDARLRAEIFELETKASLENILSRFDFNPQEKRDVFPALRGNGGQEGVVEEHNERAPRGSTGTSGAVPSPMIVQSSYKGLSHGERMRAIVSEYNGSRPSIMTSSYQWLSVIFNFFGHVFKRLKPNEFRLVSRNNIPELVAPSEDKQRMTLTFNPKNESKEIQTFSQTAQQFGANGHYVLNVPLGQYAKVSFNNDNRLYGEGQHVIHNQNFKTPDDYLVNQNDAYIHHKDIHLFNVRPGCYAKVRIGYDYHFLPSGKHQIRSPNLVFDEQTGIVNFSEGYIKNGNLHTFNIPAGYFAKIKIGNEFKLLDTGTHFIESGNLFFNPETDLVSQLKVHINHGNIHILNIPKGYMALVYENNTPKILESGHHVINNGNFEFDEKYHLVRQDRNYISHQNIHRVLVQPGHIALVSVDGETRILKGQEEPYFFMSNNFSIAKDKEDFTFSQNTKQISFNGIHYLLPDQGEVAVLNDGAELIILPNEDYQRPEKGEAFLWKSGTASFKDFVDTRMQTIEFPSQEIQKERIKAGTEPSKARFDRFQTAEGTNVAVRFVVTYQIEDPKKALQVLQSREEIERHIERLVNADMGNAISNTSFWNLLNSNRTNASSDDSLGEKPKSGATEKEVYWQDKVKAELHRDLKECGIHLGRLNIEETVVLDQKTREQMERQSLSATNAKSKLAILQTSSLLAQAEAMQDRQMAKLELETKTTTAKLSAELELSQNDLQKELAIKQETKVQEVKKVEMAANLERQVMEAEAKKEMRTQEAEGMFILQQKEAEGQTLKLEADTAGKRLLAELMEKNPAFQQAEIARYLSEALKGSQYLAAAGMYNKMPPALAMANTLEGITRTSSDLAKGTLSTGLGNMMAQNGFFSTTQQVEGEKPAPLKTVQVQ
jgi:regulator of protease activity HflC (stomatin/prohibitin superfamily)